MVIDGGTFGVFSNNNGPEENDDRDVKLYLENCAIKDTTGKGIYCADAKVVSIKNCVIENVATGTDTGTTGDYGVDINLIGVTRAIIEIEDTEFKGYQGAKAAVKVTQRGGPSDEGAGDIPMDKGEASISSFTMKGCSFNTETPVDVRIGTAHKTPDQPNLDNTTADFPVTIQDNTTDTRVYVAATGDELTIPAGASGYKSETGDFVIIGGGDEPEPGPEEPGAASIGDVQYETIDDALAALKDGDTIVFNEDYDKPIRVNGIEITFNLNGHTITPDTAVWNPDAGIISMLASEGGANVTITGNGAIKTLADDSYAVDVQPDSTMTIENGTFIGNITAAYVQGGHLYVKGGDFSIQQLEPTYQDERFTLNCLDSAYRDGTATIEVTGGTFNKFDPANNLAEGANTNFCPEGYSSVKEGDKYTVAKA